MLVSGGAARAGDVGTTSCAARVAAQSFNRSRRGSSCSEAEGIARVARRIRLADARDWRFVNDAVVGIGVGMAGTKAAMAVCWRWSVVVRMDLFESWVGGDVEELCGASLGMFC